MDPPQLGGRGVEEDVPEDIPQPETQRSIITGTPGLGLVWEEKEINSELMVVMVEPRGEEKEGI